jgi:hypothetical protein
VVNQSLGLLIATKPQLPHSVGSDTTKPAIRSVELPMLAWPFDLFSGSFLPGLLSRLSREFFLSAPAVAPAHGMEHPNFFKRAD